MLENISYHFDYVRWFSNLNLPPARGCSGGFVAWRPSSHMSSSSKLFPRFGHVCSGSYCGNLIYFGCYCPKCSVNPISVTPIWKQKFVNGNYPIKGLYRIFFEKFAFKFLFSHKRFQIGKNVFLWIMQAVTEVLNKSHYGNSHLQMRQKTHSLYRAFWAQLFEDHCFWRLMEDVFLGWFWALS